MDVTGDSVPADRTAARAARSVHPPAGATALLWLAVMAGPLAAFLNQQLSYALVTWACERPDSAFPRMGLHAVPAVFLALVLGATVFAWRSRRTDPPATDQPPPAGRVDFLALLGVGLGVAFSLVILAEWTAAAVLRVCNQS